MSNHNADSTQQTTTAAASKAQNGRTKHLRTVLAWLPVALRAIAVLVTAYPAVRKFTQYGYRVEEFAAYGIPWPELAVPVTGAIELVAIALLTVGIAGRLGAGMLTAGMFVVAATAGSNPFSIVVLVASIGVLILGTGPYSYWDPTIAELQQHVRRLGKEIKSSN
jgi:putative oxidoreductase